MTATLYKARQSLSVRSGAVLVLVMVGLASLQGCAALQAYNSTVGARSVSAGLSQEGKAQVSYRVEYR